VNQAFDNCRARRRRARPFSRIASRSSSSSPASPRLPWRRAASLHETRRRSLSLSLISRSTTLADSLGEMETNAFAAFLARSRSFATVTRASRVLIILPSVLNDPSQPGDACRHFKLRRREKTADKAAHNHVVDFLLDFIESWGRCRSDDGEVIRNLGVVIKSFRGLTQLLSERCAHADSRFGSGRFYRRDGNPPANSGKSVRG